MACACVPLEPAGALPAQVQLYAEPVPLIAGVTRECPTSWLQLLQHGCAARQLQRRRCRRRCSRIADRLWRERGSGCAERESQSRESAPGSQSILTAQKDLAVNHEKQLGPLICTQCRIAPTLSLVRH